MTESGETKRRLAALATILLAGALTVVAARADDTAGVKKYDPATVSGEVAKGGYLLILQAAASGGTGAGGDCGSVLSDAERNVAESIGNGFRAKNIPVSRIVASERCSAIETARALDLGEVQVDPDLNPVDVDTRDADEVARLKRMLAAPTSPDSNVLLVSHRDNVNRLLKIDVKSTPGTLHALRTGDGSVTYVGSVAPGDWPADAD